ncbi:MAG TPA: branched-chain alpha-keto acid dehydrogenase subunit E2 [Bacteroidales bacterium]|nr:branched-chain alpha-keto acid dehydrogenase subunit E2 [Bacteroidales bacterium]
MKKEIKIPDIAENVEKGLIASVLVSKGDKVSKDQALVEIETDKATTDIPSDYDGVIDEVKVSEGDEVSVHQVIMIIEVKEEEDNNDEKEKEPDDDKPKENQNEETTDQKSVEKEEKTISERAESEDIPAAPSVRRLARELGVDLLKIDGSGPGGRITKEDVENYTSDPVSEPKQKTQLSDFSKWGPVSREDMNNIRRVTAKSLSEAWQTVPHVTQFDEADITKLEEFRKKNQDKIEKAGGKLTVTSLLLKIVGLALQKFPQFNASVDMDNKQIIYKHYYNVGIAVDTEQGLLVPVVRDVNKKSLANLSAELSDLAKKARNKELSLDQMQGGNFTISNLGGIGGTGFTPIVYYPQVAILGVSRSKYQQVLVGDEFEKRLVIPLSLSYDHRIIDGADGARFLRWICDVIEDPYAILF